MAATPATGFLIQNGTTPGELAYREKLAAAMMQSGMNASPIQSPWQGAARLAQSLIGGLTMANSQDEEKSERAKATANLLQAAQGGGQSTTPAAAPMTTASISSGPFNASKTGAFDPGDTEMQAGLITPTAYQPEVLDAAKKNNIDPLLYARQLQQESGFNPSAVSPKGATGVAQFMPETAADRGVNAADPTSSIYGGANYLSDLKKQFGGDDRLGLMAYNWGPANVQKWIANGSNPNDVPAETRDYVARILPGGGGAPTAVPAAQPQNSSSRFGLLQAAMNPWLGSAGQALAGKILANEFAPTDTGSIKEYNLAKGQGYKGSFLDYQKELKQAGPNGKFGLTPIYGRDASGNPAIGVLGKDGNFHPINTGDFKVGSPIEKIDVGPGYQINDKRTGAVIGYLPKDLRGAEAQKAQGKAEGQARGQAITTLGANIQQADQSIGLIDQMLTHPGLDTAVGLSGTIDPRNYIAGTDASNFNVMRKQLEGKAFLQAFQSLKGAGQITEIEGQKATAAIARLSTTQSEAEYRKALLELRGILEQGKARAKAMAAGDFQSTGQTAPSGKTTGGVSWSVE